VTKLAKLDRYDYEILPGVIRIRLNKTNDPILVDIMSDIRNSDGKVYVEDFYYLYLDKYEIVRQGKISYLDLHVMKTKTI
jgi:hypothetical protein